MKLTVLVDNCTLIDRYFQGEPGVSYFIECDGEQYLFDTGYSDLFIKNAIKMGLNLKNLAAIILSHGHNDHTWGLGELVKLYAEDGCHIEVPALVAHPDALLAKREAGQEIGMILSFEQLERSFTVMLSKTPLWLTDKLVFLGEVPRKNGFEVPFSIGKTLKAGVWVEDFVLDDSALVYLSDKGLVIITGCSHAGICNIVEYAKCVTNEKRVYEIIGGFHLLQPSHERLAKTKEYMTGLRLHRLYAGHCTDLFSKVNLSEAASLGEVGVGLVIDY